jgi:cytochrome c biogenesis protein CcmG/thiol:disulfide interchange protein DsbE
LTLAGVLVWTGCAKKARRSSAKPAPEFNLKDASGQTVRLADYRGKVVLLDFSATWCGPCKIEIPWFMEFEKEFKDQGFAVLGVSMDEDGWSAIKPYVQNMKMNYRVLLGNDAISTAYGGLDSLPTTLLIDREGGIASTHVGVSMGKEEFKDAIVKLLETTSVSAPVAPRDTVAVLARPGSR